MSIRSALLLLTACMATGIALGQDTRTVAEPVIPTVKCATLQASLTADSTPSGGLTLAQETNFDTSRIQAALTGCAAGQAVELQPAGVYNSFLIQPISIPAGVTLLVDAGVTVLASRNPADYQKGTSTNCGTVGGAGSGCQPLISINNAPGAAIMGYGAIDGRGGATMLVNGADTGQTWWDLANGATAGNEVVPILLNVGGSVNVTLYRVTFQNSTHFHITASSGDNMIVWGTKIITPYDTRNTDGLDPGGFNNMTIANSYFSDGDDEIALTGGSSPLTQNLSVTNNTFFSGHGMSIGSHTTYGIQNVLVSGLTINEDPSNSNGTGLRIKSDAASGGLVQNVTYQNVCMQNVASPIVMTAYYDTATGTSIPQYRNINFHNVHALTAGKISFIGYDNSSNNGVTDLLGMNLNNVSIDGITSNQATSQYTQFALGSDPVNFASFLAGVGDTVTNNVSNANVPYSCPAALFNILAGEIVHGPSTVQAGQSTSLQVQILTPKETSYAAYMTAHAANPAAMLRLAVPTGTVSLMEGTTALGTTTLVPSAALGNANTLSVTIGTLAPGMHTITGLYSGDANYLSQKFGSYNLLVTAGNATTTTLSASATAAIPGQSITFTAAVAASTTASPTGTVTFYDGSYPLATAAVVGGSAAFTTTTLSNISHTITAVYSGDASFANSTSNAVVVTVTQAKSAVTFTASATTVTLGQPITFTASVAASGGSSVDVPTGNMAFKVNGKTPSNMTLVNGGISWTVVTSTASYFAVGSNTTFGSYGGDTNFTASASPNLIITIVAGAATTSTLSSSAASIVPGQNVTFTAQVASSAAGAPSGSFTFYDGTTLLGTSNLNGTSATYSTTSLAVGSHSITATYNGDSVFSPSTSAATVVSVALAQTTVALTSNAGNGRATPGQSVSFTAAISVATGGSPSGSITFYDGMTTLASVPVSSGSATFTTSTLPAGAHTLLASYSGDANFGSSQSNTVYVVVSSSAASTPVPPVLLPQVITTIAGNGTAGTTGDGGLATAATIASDLRGLAVDGFGTVYLADSTNGRIRAINQLSGLIRLYQGGGTVCASHIDSIGDGCLALQTSGDKPRGLATDRTGSLYIGGYTDNLVHRVDAVTNTMTLVAGQVASVSSSGTAGIATDGTVATAAPLSGPRGVWVDNLGNVYIADVTNKQIRMVYSAGSFAGLSTTSLVKGDIYLVAGNGGSTNVDKGLATASGTSGPQGVYVDNQQNIYIADSTRLRVVYQGGAAVANLIAATNAGTTATAGYIYTVAGGGSGTYTAGQVVLGTNIALSSITKIAADSNGNLYLGDGGRNVVWFFDAQTGFIRIVAGGAAAVCATATDTIGDGCTATAATLNVGSSAQAVAFDAASNLYISDPGNARIRKVSSNLNFPATPTGASITQTIVVHFGASDAAASYVFPLASGDFKVSGTPTCVLNADNTSDCTVQVVFAPAKPGFRTAPLVVTATSGAASTLVLSGTGMGAALVLNPGSTGTLGTGLSPQGVAVDAAGNTYVADARSGSLLKYAAGSTTPVTLATGLSQPYQTAVDGAGNVYVADSGNNRVLRVSVNGALSAIGTGLSAPRGVAVDPLGNVYIADTGNSRVVELPAAPGSQVVLGSGFNGPTNLAVDSASNLYVLDFGNSRVVQIGPGAATQPVLSLGSVLPSALAVDAAADLYITDLASEQVIVYPAGSSTGTALVGGFGKPSGLAVDAAGTLYVADTGAPALTLLNRAAGSITFANSSTPVSATLTNIGNNTLTFNTPSLSQTDTVDFSVTASSSGGCTFPGGTLSPGAACGVAGIYSPQSTGTQTDVVTFASNGGSNVLTLTGTGVLTVGTTTAVSAPTPASPIFGQAISFTATVAATSGSTTPSGTVTFTVDSNSLAPIPLTNGKATGSFTGLTAGSHTVSALFSPAGAFAPSSSGTTSFTIGQAKPILSWTAPASLGYGTALAAVQTATAGGSLPGTYAYTATATAGAAVAITATSFLPVGTYSLGVTFTPADSVDYATATATIASLTIVQASTTAGVGPTQNVVAADGSGNYATLPAAIAALPTTGGTIYVRPGTYKGQSLISTSNVQLRGLGGDPSKVVLTASNSYGTSGSDQASATLGVTGSNFYMENIYLGNTFQADNPTVTTNTQSVALWLTGDKDVVYNSQIIGGQDTLYANNGPSREYYYQTKVAGNVDYIFGDAAAVFDNCNLYSVYHGGTSGGITITAQKKLNAPGSPTDYLSGYVVINSQLTNEVDQGAPTSLLYGRPWGMYSTNLFINDFIQTLAPAGWSEFTPGVTNNLPTSTYAEYGNYGPGSSTVGREQYAFQLTAAQAALYAPDTFLSGPDSWSPTAALKTYIAAVVPSITSLSIAANSSVTMVARIAPPALGTPTGTLTFYDGTKLLTTVALDLLGEASYTTSTLGNGSHSITVQYSGDANFTASTSTAVVVTSGSGSMSTLQLQSASLAYGQGTTATATVTATTGTATPTGTATFQLDGSPLASSPLSGGAATITIPATTPAGTHTLAISYGGDTTFAASQSAPLSFTVAKAVLTATGNTTAITYASTIPALSVALTGFVNAETASVVSGSAAITTTATSSSPVGSYPVIPALGSLTAANYSFTFSNGAITINKAAATITIASASKLYGAALPTFTATATGLVNGDTLGTTLTAAYTTAATATSPAGSYPITATIAGSAAGNYNVTLMPGTLTITKAASAAALTSSATTVTTGSSVTLTATLNSTAGVPTGAVTFLSGSTSLGSATLNPQGVATLSTSALALGANAITASYAGDANFAGSVSNLVTITGVVPPSFSLSAAPASLNIVSGSAGSPTITLTPVGGYTGTATLSCGTLPADVFCTFAPTSLIAAGTNAPVSSTLTISTNGRAALYRREGTKPLIFAGLVGLPFLLLLARKQGRNLRGLVAACAAAALIGIAGCGSNNLAATNTNATPGTSTIVVTASVGGVAVQTVNLTITIQ